MYDFDTPFSSSFNLSKNRDLLILNNGTFSLENSFFIGAITNKSTTNNYVNFKLVSNNVIDNTDYRKIYFQSGETSFLLCSYSFSNSLFKEYQNEISESYSLLIRTFVRIFNDASGKCDYEDVRATEEEEKLLDKLIEQKTN